MYINAIHTYMYTYIHTHTCLNAYVPAGRPAESRKSSPSRKGGSEKGGHLNKVASRRLEKYLSHYFCVILWSDPPFRIPLWGDMEVS